MSVFLLAIVLALCWHLLPEVHFLAHRNSSSTEPKRGTQLSIANHTTKYEWPWPSGKNWESYRAKL